MVNKLTLTALEKAIQSLAEALEAYNKTLDEFIRDAVIQRFEYTYELSHKLLKRHLEMTSANPDEIDTLSFQDLIRLGSEHRLLLSGWDQWSHFRKLRGATSHTYDESKALEVIKQIPQFYEEAHFLLKQLQAQNL